MTESDGQSINTCFAHLHDKVYRDKEIYQSLVVQSITIIEISCRQNQNQKKKHLNKISKIFQRKKIFHSKESLMCFR